MGHPAGHKAIETGVIVPMRRIDDLAESIAAVIGVVHGVRRLVRAMFHSDLCHFGFDADQTRIEVRRSSVSSLRTRSSEEILLVRIEIPLKSGHSLNAITM